MGVSATIEATPLKHNNAKSINAASPALRETPATESVSPFTWMELSSQSVRVETLFNFAAGWTDQDSEAFEPRPLLSLHRARIWLKGKLTRKLKYVTHFAFDRIGADQFSLLQGKPGDTNRFPMVQDLLLRYDHAKSGQLRITGGFFRPFVGRENASAVIALPNHDIALTGVLARRGSTGTGHGRATGLNLGGRLQISALKVIYQAGAFGPTTAGSIDGTDYEQSIGAQGSPLFAGGLTLAFGKPAQLVGADYLFLPNPWKDDFGLAFGASSSVQGETEQFNQSNVYSGFAALNWSGLFIDGEYVLVAREDASSSVHENSAWHLRAGYNIYLTQSALTPFILVSELDGGDAPSSVKLFAGKRRVTDAGVNWHFNRNKLQLGLHAIISEDASNEAVTPRQPAREGQSFLMTFQIRH